MPSFLEKIAAAVPTVDVVDFVPEVIDSIIVEDDEGTEGAWDEEARAPYRVYKITRLSLSDLSDYPELRDELKALKPGDSLRFRFDYKEGHEKVEVEDVAVVKKLRWLADDVLQIEPLKLYGIWTGEKPPQSQAGR